MKLISCRIKAKEFVCLFVCSLRCDLQLNSYPQGFTDSIINSKGNNLPKKEVKALDSVYIPYVKGVSGKFKCIRYWYNIRTIFRMKHALRGSLTRNQARERSATDGTVYLKHSL
jgi:hypothetical protein